MSATGVWDWSEAAAHYESARHTFFYHNQFPLWNPYVCGGSPALSNPQAYWMSITGLFAFLLDSTTGPKIAVAVYVGLGGLGAWLFARRLGVRDEAALLVAPVYMVSGFLATRLAAGQFLWLTIAYVPWVFYSYVRARHSLWWLVWGGLALAMIGIEGRSYLLVYVVMMLMAYGLVEDLSSKGRAWGMGRAVGLVVMAFGLGAWKFLPDLFFLVETQGSLTNSPALPVGLLPEMLLKPTALPDSWEEITSLQWVEFGAYIGWLPLILGVVAVMKGWVRQRLAPLMLAGIVMLAVALSLPAGNVLEHWPVVKEFRNYHRAMGMVILVIAVASAFGLEVFVRWLRLRSQRLKTVIYWSVILCVTIDFLAISSFALGKAFAKVADKTERDDVYIAAVFKHESGFNDPFTIVRKNQGAKDACPAVLYAWLPNPPGSAVVAADDPGNYRGEAYLLDDAGDVQIVNWSPNEIEVVTESKKDGVLVINQNYSLGWRSSVGRVVSSEDRLLTVKVPPGQSRVRLNYWPLGLTYGLIISGLLLGWLLWRMFRQRVWVRWVGKK